MACGLEFKFQLDELGLNSNQFGKLGITRTHLDNLKTLIVEQVPVVNPKQSKSTKVQQTPPVMMVKKKETKNHDKDVGYVRMAPRQQRKVNLVFPSEALRKKKFNH